MHEIQNIFRIGNINFKFPKLGFQFLIIFILTANNALFPKKKVVTILWFALGS